ncbi:MAG: DUF5360 family protein [Trueperaceae bacterium]
MLGLSGFFLVTDIGFIVYWLLTALALIPPEYAFNDYKNPIMTAWNWSFLPLDLLISETGLTAVYLHRKKNSSWLPLALMSLVLTVSSGLNAIAFWVIRGDFDLAWWLPNLYLMLYPLFLFLESCDIWLCVKACFKYLPSFILWASHWAIC